MLLKRYSDNKSSELKLEDLLGRMPAMLDTGSIRDYIRNKTILVTGAAGSIGSEICRQALDFECGKLILFDIHENGLYETDNELKKKFDQCRYDVIVGSIRDNPRLSEIFSRYAIDTVFHAAAHKHVPLMESNPTEAIKNNIIGTLNTAGNAIKYGAKKFILVSTDKAVNCTSIMGATKRIAELTVQLINKYAPVTELAAVRFGNVLGSNGSVIPMFQEQIWAGGPVTVTHPEMERYFMTIMEAVLLVLQAGAMAQGGEIFVLDMGKPVKILDLANCMIRRSGLEPGKDIEIMFTGLRPGEKMSEEISFQNETLSRTENNKIFRCGPVDITADFLIRVKELEEIVDKKTDIDYKALLNGIIESALR